MNPYRRPPRDAWRFGRIGVCFGLALAAVWIIPQARADIRGVNLIEPGEMMFVTSVPFSFLTWLGWLLPASSLFGSGAGVIPRWVAYSWMVVTPPLNWGVVGWLVGHWRDRQAMNQ